jgi:hypothetical protein
MEIVGQALSPANRARHQARHGDSLPSQRLPVAEM